MRFFSILINWYGLYRKIQSKIIFLWPFLGIVFSLTPLFQIGSTLRANIQQMWICNQSKLHHAITSHTDSIHIKYKCFMPDRSYYGYGILITEYWKIAIQIEYESTFDVQFSWTCRSHNNSYIFGIYARNCTGRNKIIRLGQTVLEISFLKKWTSRSFAICLQNWSFLAHW